MVIQQIHDYYYKKPNWTSAVCEYACMHAWVHACVSMHECVNACMCAPVSCRSPAVPWQRRPCVGPPPG